MNPSGDAAEQVVRMSLEATEIAARITGVGAKQVAVLLYAVMRDQQKTRGKMRLNNMLKSGKELKVFAVKDKDIPKFCAEAKKYGVLYCVLKDRNAEDGITDVMIRAEDVSKVNRIFERFNLSTVDMASIKSELLKVKEKIVEAKEENPKDARKEKNPQSGPSSKNKKDLDNIPLDEEKKPSVKEQLKSIREELTKGDKEINVPVRKKNKGAR